MALDGFNSFYFSAALYLLSGAGIKPLFDVRICSLKKGSITSRDGLTVEASDDLSVFATADVIIVPSSEDTGKSVDPVLCKALQDASEKGSLIVGLCLGAYILSYAGLTDHRNVATHWAFEEEFKTRFPYAHLQINKLYVEDGNILTSAGGTAALDCCLYLIKKFFGVEKANEVARLFVFPTHRDGEQAQFVEHPMPESPPEVRIKNLLIWLEENLDQPHSIDSLSRAVRVSPRTFSRHFKHITGETLTEWLTRKRLNQARLLLESTPLRIGDIGYRAGFNEIGVFRKAFLKRFGKSPRNWRKEFQK